VGVALISLLLSFIGKKIGSIIQAIFGWSVTALFGRLPGMKQLAVSIALVLSIAWPVFVTGLFLPRVAGWALAFLPIGEWVSPLVLRIVWGALAFLAPLIVGGLVHWAAPATKGSAFRSLVNGYPLALGFLVAFLVTVVTVPLVKLASILRGWSDEHVYLQPRADRYDAVLRELAEACARAGVLPEITDVPLHMSLATTALKTLARGTVTPIVAEQVKRVRGDGLELYLYPSDLLLRGTPEKVSLVRAMLTRTDVDKDAYLVGSPKAQSIQDELGRLIDVMASHEKKHVHVGGTIAGRLVDIWNEMNQSKLPFEEWVMLESIIRRVERRLVREDVGTKLLPLDEEDDELDKIAGAANAVPARKTRSGEEENAMAIQVRSAVQETEVEETSTADLVREAMDEAKELVRLEVELAKEEVKEEVKQAKRAAIAFSVAGGAAVIALCMLAVALVLALGGTALAALGVAGGFLVLGAVAGYAGYGMLPKAPLEKTRHRLHNDVNQLKEHIA
jgi:uncharacterized membrane protein YqjE